MKPPSPTLLFNRAALREIDRRAVEEFSIPVLLLMENAGRAVAQAALRHLKPSASVALLCGSGNNGGDGLVAARHLHNASIPVHLFLLDPPSKFKNEPATHLAIAEKMKLPIETLTPGHAELRDWIVDGHPDDLIIDALFGTGLCRPVAGLAAEVIVASNASRRTILSIDIPSGLDTDTGEPLGAAIRAAETISFCGNKLGFTQPGAAAYTGKITIADIAAPLELLRELAM
jgi:NAD(P)H-hydrate epimerase